MRHPLYERIGKFRIKKDDLDQLPDWLQQMMARVIVLRAEFCFEEDGIEYTALCPEFNRCSAGSVAHRYSAVIEYGRFLRFAP